MHLVKDLYQSKVVYYFLDSDIPDSPLFKSIEEARQWLIQLEQSKFKGKERRSRTTDRRRDPATSKHLAETMGLARSKPKGRRSTDLIEVEVAIDLYQERVSKLVSVS